MIITFGTQKGGAGKTTLAIAFANYLALAGNRVQVYDYDFQKSFHTKWKEDEIFAKPQLYDVVIPGKDSVPFDDFDSMMRMRSDESVHLFDLAGTLDMKYNDILQYSDFIIIPFEYSDVSVQSTLVFINFLGLLESEAHKVFIRSRFEANYRYPNKIYMDNEIGRFGFILNGGVRKHNALQKINTRSLDSRTLAMLRPLFEELIFHIGEKTGETLNIYQKTIKTS